ncbi:MAG: phosphoribosyl-AMP cyclohydrolase [Pseudomonadota bacterium]
MTKTRPWPSQESLDEPIEETSIFAPRFDEKGLIPAVAIDHQTGKILMLAYMNAEALAKTLETGDAHYWSRSRQSLWRKGETSGATQRVVEVRTDCDQDAIELVVEQEGPACHTKRPRCFYRRVDQNGELVICDEPVCKGSH